MFTQPFIGASYLLRGFFLLFKPGIRRFVILPMLINLIVFSLLIWLGIFQFDILMEYVMGNLPEWLQWLDWLLWPLFLIAFLLVGFTFSLHLALLIAAPFNGLLSEAVERHLDPTSTLPVSSWGDIIKGIVPTIISEAGKIGYFIIRAIPLTALFFIPGINLLAPAIWAILAHGYWRSNIATIHCRIMVCYSKHLKSWSEKSAGSPLASVAHHYFQRSCRYSTFSPCRPPWPAPPLCIWNSLNTVQHSPSPNLNNIAIHPLNSDTRV